MRDGGSTHVQNKTLKLLLAGAAALIVLLAILAGFLWWQYGRTQTKKSGAAAAETSNRIISKVDELFLLPKNEEPTVAEVRDMSKLQDREFFENAKEGDYLLVYSKSKVALLYRESADKLVTVGPVNDDPSNATQTQ